MNGLVAVLTRRTTWAAVLVLAAVVLTGWALFPYLPTAGRVLTIAYLALVVAGLVLRGTVYTVWLAGIVAVVTPVLLLLLAQTFVDGDARTGLRGLIYLYVAGTLGGLVLELLQQKRYVLEKPCLIPRAAAEGNQAVLREGPMWHLGFLSRMFIGGLAGAALVTLIGSVLGNLHVGSATEPGALVWAIVAGSAAPAVWKLLNDVMLKRGNAMDEVLAAIEQQAVRNATPTPPPPPPQNGRQAPVQQPQQPDDLAVSMARAMRHLV